MKKSILIGWTEPYRQKFNISNTYTFSVWCWFLHASALHGHLLDWCGHAFCAYQMYVVKCHPHISIENSNMKFTNFFVDFFIVLYVIDDHGNVCECGACMSECFCLFFFCFPIPRPFSEYNERKTVNLWKTIYYWFECWDDEEKRAVERDTGGGD